VAGVWYPGYPLGVAQNLQMKLSIALNMYKQYIPTSDEIGSVKRSNSVSCAGPGAEC
jgi:hypothetical protein